MLWQLARFFRNVSVGGPRFVIRVRDYRAEAVKGKVTQRFLNEVSEIARSDGVPHGLIDALPPPAEAPRGTRMVAFRFSPHFPSVTQQRIRNVYQLEL